MNKSKEFYLVLMFFVARRLSQQLGNMHIILKLNLSGCRCLPYYDVSDFESYLHLCIQDEIKLLLNQDFFLEQDIIEESQEFIQLIDGIITTIESSQL